MGWSQIDFVYVEDGTLNAGGHIQAQAREVTQLTQSLRFILVQGDQAVSADAPPWGANWTATVEAPGVTAGKEALAMAVATRVYDNPANDLPLITEVITWSETLIVGSGPPSAD
jgi:hypothetical protein